MLTSWLRRVLRRRTEAPRAPEREALDDWLRAGYEHQKRGELAEAERLYSKILDHDPDDADALFFLGIIAMNDGREARAAELLERAIGSRPNDPVFWSTLGVVCYQLRRLEQGAAVCRRGIALQPENTDNLNNLAALLAEAGNTEEARDIMEQLIASGRGLAHAYFNLGGIYRDYGRLDEAIAACRKGVELNPDNPDAYVNLLLTLNYSPACDPATFLQEHRRFGARFARPYVEPQPDRTWPRRLRVGYLSPDFRKHAVAQFSEPILANHDRERFEIFCYYNQRHVDESTRRFRELADHWLDCVHFSDNDLAERIRADGIDLLVDLAGHTNGQRLRVFAAKAAPVQLSYLGYPNTTGLAAVDYRITDDRADPPAEADPWSVEQLLRPWPTYFCYRPPLHAPETGPLPATATGKVTFGSFNNFPKLSGPFLDAAARILAAVPGSRLKLKSKTLSVPNVAHRVRERFVGNGIDPARLDLVGWEKTLESHLAAYGSIDIAIDTFPYNGATTTCEALWMGVPVVTLAGDRHAGRMGSSLLNAVRLGELVAKDVDTYIATCASLAADLGGLAQLRSSMRERMLQSPLMDEAGFTRALERSYVEIWERKIRPDTEGPAPSDEAITEALHAAAALRAAGKASEAEAAYQAVLLKRPDQAEALTALWDFSHETGNHGAVIDWLRKGITANGRAPMLHYMMGCSLLEKGNAGEAVASFQQALALQPSMAKAHNNLGCALEAIGQPIEARECYRRAVDLDPKLADALYNLGNIFRQLGDTTRAVEHIRQALEGDPGRADWHCNLGDLLCYRLELDEAVQSYGKAVAADREYARAYSGRALALQELGLVADAEADLQKAMELQPDNAGTHSNRLYLLHFRQGDEPRALFDAHVTWAQRHTSAIGRQAARAGHERYLRRRLNIGYVSPDFNRHSSAPFIEPVLAAHDRKKFKVFCYSNVVYPDDVTQRLRGLSEEWRDISAMPDPWVAQQMRADHIDILVDLAGHTGGGRMLLFARKPAPVQVSWLGYPGTTGLAAMDHRLSDDIADPEGQTERFHSEALMRLPDGFLCYRAPAESPEVGSLPLLNSGRVTFGSFNNLANVTPSMIACWAQILNALPGARLVLKAPGLVAPSARQAILDRFSERGIPGERLELCGPEESPALNLAKYNEIDIALDVFPFNGVTAACEALWMGVPVVTLAGRTHVSRAGASILTQVGLADFVAVTGDDYVQKALGLARDVEKLRALRAGMRERMRSSPLLDADGFTRALENAYEKMWEQWCEAEEQADSVLRLHVGGLEARHGWKILNVQPGPGVDYVGDCTDLSQFADASVDEIYASHVLEHLGFTGDLPRALSEFNRVLKQGGAARISVPDFEILCRMFLDPAHSMEQRLYIMAMTFGGQTDPHDFHYVGLTFEFLHDFLLKAGFSRIERVKEFGLFHDTSVFKYADTPISLNVIAYK